MDVHLSLANHGEAGRQTVLDQLIWLVAGLEENGHSISVSEECIDTQKLNIFWEYFPPSLARYLIQNRINYGIIATELPDGGGFNNRRADGWTDRWRGFRLAGSHARFIWCLAEDAVDAYRQFAPTAYLELGFTERMVPAAPRAKPTYDFSFAGTPREHRKHILDRLGERASVRYAGTLLGHHDQLNLLRDGRVSLALKQSPEWKWGSPSRVGRLVHERIPVAQEWVPVDIGVTRLVPKPAEGEDFVEWVLGRLDQDLESEADEIFEAYREMPMRECVARALDLTL